MEVRYILLRPGEGVRESLRSLGRPTEGRGGFRTSVLGANAVGMEDVLQEMETRHPHPVLRCSGREGHVAGRALHRKDAVYAYNVRYIPPRAMGDEQKEEFESHKRNLEQVLAHCDDLSIEDKSVAA